MHHPPLPAVRDARAFFPSFVPGAQVPWLKLLHISAVILWSGSLLYMTAAIATAAGSAAPVAVDPVRHGVLRAIFTLMATPAALVAIASGTTIFLLQGPVAPWLIAKLAVVGLLVLGHGVCGMLVLRTERQAGAEGTASRGVRVVSGCVAAASVLWLGVIAWLVLAKPF
ncbi:CopD family protein [Ramlibacter sp. AW1]|uniref:Protoporphyrinogen IX oxidase n=1 Tax=Ramlibacter aurantiacus TaxID=2801330 RepID=A0A936ZLA9_9BURK|nr:CopD family protein [Ramlibacter aurantiacus]MBL0419335.1 CopD family protein [Ramlibacter aurantiacus]